jgi:hypothetical protein
MANFTSSKMLLVSGGRIAAASIFFLGTVQLVFHPRGPLFHAQLVCMAATGLIFLAFPIAWILFPRWHPVNRALLAHSVEQRRLDEEMARTHDELGPFHFCESLLVYSPGHTLDVVPYEAICSALKEPGYGDDATSVVIQTKGTRTYRWPRTWIQGIFDPDKVLATIRERAGLPSSS